jgi:glucokinase
MQIGGPECGCGNRGCLEALASRTAIERDIRAAIQSGRKSVVTKLTNGDLTVIKSSVLSRALKQEDEVVTGVMRRAAEMLGYACLTVRHLLDPEVIVLGGGVIEACGEFIMPIVEQILGLHSMPGSVEKNVLAVSELGDDAVAIGAAALVRSQLEHQAGMPAEAAPQDAVTPHIMSDAGALKIDGVTYDGDVLIRADGRVKRPAFALAADADGFVVLRAKIAARLCKGAPRTLIIGVAAPERISFSDKADAYLQAIGVTRHVCTIADAIALYRKEETRRALYLHRPPA